ncbi:hypothetical protein IscW_ISCW006836 [Ixodes scapularis]|uniref:Uncharacterized protein n=1 Tax=Ixodes scapularis TaxID=6945 RepID=B7PQY8_IXOSC|nr:hypothetical protein IscW_ISCW006836 [Ixodes scapularis]|eukprot:XP_002436180.1 hypothetical protein IscW_ISCW006836 [Ixodes scapularis]
MDQQRSMMMSHMRSNMSVVMRPSTQATGGMMQYLLTLIFVLVLFWATIFVVYFVFISA